MSESQTAPPPHILLGNKSYSSWSLRPWLAMKALDIAFTEETLPLRTDLFHQRLREVAPEGNALVPTLVHGEQVVWDSLAILEYLNDAFPNAGIWPSDPTARAHARTVSAEMHAGFMALRQNCPMNLRHQRPKTGAKVAPLVAEDISRIDTIWSDCRARFGETGPYLFGAFSGADAMYAPVASRIWTYGLPVSETAKAYVETIMANEAMGIWITDARAEPWTRDLYDQD